MKQEKGWRLLAFGLVLALLGGCLLQAPIGQKSNTYISARALETVASTAATTQMQNTESSETTVQTATTQTAATTQVTTTVATTALNSTERKAVWISYSDLDFKVKTRKNFTAQVKKMFDTVKKMGMNTVVVHVRPFGDAMYQSEYFPWSKIASGKQGKNPGYDPLEILVEQAHARGLSIEAWVNPYRVTLSSTRISSLSKDNPARKWYAKSSTRRNVLSYGGQLYYNPSKSAVRQLIVNGVCEIVENYDVDGIHFDDYFYPSFTRANYKSAFDAKEYRSYVKKQKKKSETARSITGWRRQQVNLLIRQVYQAIKDMDPEVTFGVSPAGNLENLRSKTSYYVDIDSWVAKEGYVDYICPQIYWGFKNGRYSYDKMLDQWVDLCQEGNVTLYVGLAMYRTVYYGSSEWRTSNTIMQRSVRYARKTGQVDGFYFFTYSSFLHSRAAKEKKNLVAELKKKS